MNLCGSNLPNQPHRARHFEYVYQHGVCYRVCIGDVAWGVLGDVSPCRLTNLSSDDYVARYFQSAPRSCVHTCARNGLDAVIRRHKSTVLRFSRQTKVISQIYRLSFPSVFPFIDSSDDRVFLAEKPYL